MQRAWALATHRTFENVGHMSRMSDGLLAGSAEQRRWTNFETANHGHGRASAGDEREAVWLVVVFVLCGAFLPAVVAGA
ncbi:hypothetical protein K505DRAFT_151684 [Melanomma pulvis-pyrius CBS 109.77]|uniref:Uncharacterized protein n=1 Tax=Melanomma pulvis-pyrius CBS 109.77 TaxID=1314802 RepID=A0A6A6WQE6_9PLEO|nr:hypothetical protein K505DRAFT_151684 [Melanomma pulvis-pyrius CBS 109.77]